MSVSKPEEKHEDSIGETIMVIIQALLLAVVVRTFLFQPFNIPAEHFKIRHKVMGQGNRLSFL